MSNIDIGTILLGITFMLFLLDIVFLFLTTRIKNWLFYDHIILYVASITLIGSFLEFILNLVVQDWSYKYVTGYSSVEMDIPLRIASSWSGAVGSFYLWTMFMFTGYIIFRFIFRSMMDQKIYQYASIIQGFNLLAFLSFIFFKDPFAKNAVIPTTSVGLNPLLATFLNLIHPPIVFIGYSIFVIPFSLALAKIITKKNDKETPAELQKFLRFTMALAWLILGTGILIGGYWAYTTLGWGGFWAWDPVETGSLIPWLFGLVYFHGSPVFKSDKGNFSKDLIATFPFLSILFATIVTRTGALTSVHTFSTGPSDFLIILYLLVVLLIGLLFILRLYSGNEIKFFYSIEELLKLPRQDAALYISFFAFFLGTLAIMFGQVVPFIFFYLPGIVDTFNSINNNTILLFVIGIVFLGFILLDIYLLRYHYAMKNIKFLDLFRERELSRNERFTILLFIGAIIVTGSIIVDLALPVVYSYLPFGMGGTFTVGKSFFNVIIGIFGFTAIEAAFFTDFVFIKSDNNKLTAIMIGVFLGAFNVILNLPVVNFYLQKANIGPLYDLLHILGTSSILANFILPILIITFFVLIITIYKFIKSNEMQKQVKMRKVSQTFLHLGIVIALIGALFSTNSIQFNEVSLAPNAGSTGFITSSQSMNLTIQNVNYTPMGQDFTDRIQAHVLLVDSNNNTLGRGVLEYTNYNTFGLIVNVLIISHLTNDIYLTILSFNTLSGASVQNIRFEIRIVPMINLLWIGATVVIGSMLALVIISFRLFSFSYRKSLKQHEIQKNTTKVNQIPINGAL